jgi:DNA helicase II / ATP-dependent DNA helicase PcrA
MIYLGKNNVKIPSYRKQIFEELYASLNKAQKTAVDTIEGPVMVIAGPGTGKTTILTLRIANILKKTDTPPSGILAITFTEAGVKAMRMKLREIIGGRADEVAIFTFHGFAAAIIADFRDRFPHLDGTKQMTDIDAEALVRDILSHNEYSVLRPLGNVDFYVSSILKAISDAKKEAHTPEMIKVHACKKIQSIKKDDDSYSTRGVTKGKLKAEMEKEIEKCEKTIVFADLYSEYEKRKRIEKNIDFDDLIIELLVALKKDNLLLRLLQERYLYIHVDEHQDTNDSQNLLIKMLAEFFDTPNVFIVGDEKQAIYRFQGASVQNFLQFEHAWPNMRIIALTNNYRSHQSILDASFAMIENNYEKGEFRNLRVKLSSGIKVKTQPIDLISGKNTQEIQEYLTESIVNITKKDPKASIAVLTKTNKDMERIVRFLESKNIPVSSERSIDIFNHPAGSIFFDLIGFIVDPAKTELLARTLAVGLWNISFDQSIDLIQALRSTEKSRTFFPSMRSIQYSLANCNAIQALMNIAELSSYLKLIANDPASVEVWRGIVILSESLIREGNIQDPMELFKKLLAYRMSAESRSVKVPIGTPDLNVKVMTAHGSKGLEFDYVFIPYASEESWVGRPRGNYFSLPVGGKSNSSENLDHIRDARRLFYVAITRAKKHVVILNSSEEDDGRILTPLRFIGELDQRHTRPITVSIREQSSKQSRHFSTGLSGAERLMARGKVVGEVGETVPSKRQNAKLIDLAKNILITKGLSVTALNHFIECPSNFLYQSILKLPQAPSAGAEKGNAMHLALSRIWKGKDKSIGNIAKTIKESVEEYFTRSLLPISEKDLIKKELLGMVPAMSKSLAGHFMIADELEKHSAKRNQIFAEAWSENDFLGKFKDERIKISIHGRLDAIIDTGQDILVFDYKTRGKMSAAEIKGETKSSKMRGNGGYFRQLVFYKLLLENDSRFKNRNIVPSLIFLTPDSRGNCTTISIPIEKSDIEAVKANIQSLIESVWSGRIITDTCNDKECKWCQMKLFSR